MARKSKGFQELLKQKQKSASHNQKALNRLEKRLQKSPIGKHFDGIVQNPKGAVKMSEVLEEFAEPYVEEIDDFLEHKSFLELAAIAWNLAIMPEEQRQAAREEMHNKFGRRGSQDSLKALDPLLDELIERKLQLFPDNQRLIMDLQFEDSGDQYHLSVASTLASE
ncbi:MAG: hypothetical protein ACFB0E_03900 [Leptolyngbyaceae cyanobacterium]